MFGGVKLYEKWRKGYNKELMHLFGDLSILSFVSVSRLDWIGLANTRTVDSTGNVNQVKKVNQSHYRPGVAQRIPGS